MLSYILRFVLLESSGIDRYSKEFIELLLNHDVAVVADVMRFTGNRFEHFRKVNPETLLLEAGTDYIDMERSWGVIAEEATRISRPLPNFRQHDWLFIK